MTIKVQEVYWSPAVFFNFFEGGDREWLFIYPKSIIGKKYVQSVY